MSGQRYYGDALDPAQGRLPHDNYRPDPALSPFHDNAYPSHSTDSLNTGYFGARDPGRQHSDGNSPLQSRDDIPLTERNKTPGGPYTPTTHGVEGQPQNVFIPHQTQAAQRRGFMGRFSAKKIPWLVFLLSLIQVSVFIGELVKNSNLTGSPIETHPSFNPMVGPSPYVLINMGARYVPCMRNQAGVQDNSVNIAWPCPNTTDTSSQCSLSELCGMGGVPDPVAGGSLNDNPAPNQWWRFITPIFLHGGFIHIGSNLLLQLMLGPDMERAIGPIRFFLVYFASGIFGFVMGGNFAGAGVASTGCSGCLFGIIALVLLDLLYTWNQRKHPVFELAFLLFIVILSFVIGLLPAGTDNFAHIGGFLMGLVLGVCILHSPNALRKHIEDERHPGYAVIDRGSRSSRQDMSSSMVQGTQGMGTIAFIKNPVAMFKGRKAAWWIWWLIRAAALVAVLASFIVLVQDFYRYHSSRCSWCKYLTCLPVNNWCNIGNLEFQQTSPSM